MYFFLNTSRGGARGGGRARAAEFPTVSEGRRQEAEEAGGEAGEESPERGVRGADRNVEEARPGNLIGQYLEGSAVINID